MSDELSRSEIKDIGRQGVNKFIMPAIVSLGMLFGSSGCNEGGKKINPVDPTATRGPDRTPTTIVLPEPTNTPTRIPEPTPEPTKVLPTPTVEVKPAFGYKLSKEGGFVYTTEKGEIINLPQIPGLKQELQNKGEKVVYVSEKINPYGLEEKKYAGEFSPSVITSGERTGGLALTSPVVLKLIEQKLATIPDQKDKWTIPLPLDIRNLALGKDVSLSFVNGYQNYPAPLLIVSYETELPLVNMIPNSQQLNISKSIFSGYWQIYDPILRVEPYTNRIVSGKEMSYILILSSINGPNKIDCKFGDRLGEVSNKIIIGYGIVNDFREVTKRVFTVGQVPVFIAAN